MVTIMTPLYITAISLSSDMQIHRLEVRFARNLWLWLKSAVLHIIHTQIFYKFRSIFLNPAGVGKNVRNKYNVRENSV